MAAEITLPKRLILSPGNIDMKVQRTHLAAAIVLCTLFAGAARAASPDSFEVDHSLADPAPDTPTSTLALALPKPIAVRSPQLHSLDTGGDITVADRDFVSFTLSATSDVLVEADVGVGPGVTVLRLFNSAGTQLSLANTPATGTATQLIAHNLAAGTYYASVEEAGLVAGSAQTIESYFLTLETVTPGSSFPPVISNTLTATGVSGAEFHFDLLAAGTAPIAFTAVGLPSGLGVNGTSITGTPRQSGTFNVTLNATNGAAPDDSKTLVLNVSAFGIITTIAGNGVAGFSGDGDVALNAEFNVPNGLFGLTVDPTGNVFVADSANNRIRKIDAVTQVIDTVAGNGLFSVGDNGPATAAILNNPTQIATDAGGNVYFLDLQNNRVRKLTVATGIITTLVGNGVFGFSPDGVAGSQANLKGPAGIAVDPAGTTVYFSDSGNDLVRVLKNGQISTLAGTVLNGVPTAGSFGDGGPANLASLNNPLGLALDSVNSLLYITDNGNNRIRVVNLALATPTIAAFAGTGGNGFTGDGGLAVSATLSAPRDVNFDAAGVYIVDSGNNAVRLVTLATGKISTIAGSPIGKSGSTGDGGLATAALLSNPSTIAVTPSQLIVADSGNQRVRQFPLGGIIQPLAGTGTQGFGGDGGPATAALLSNPRGVTASGATIYISDTNNQRLRKVAGGVISTVAGGGMPGDGNLGTAAFLNGPMGLASDSSGNIYFADTGNRRVRKLTVATGVVSTVAGNGATSFGGDGGPAVSAALNSPQGVALDAAGNIFIADTQNSRIRMVNAAGVISTIAGTGTNGFAGDNGPAASASLNKPNSLTFDSAGNLYIADTANNSIRKIAVGTGIITTVAGTGTTTGGFAGDGGPATAALLFRPRSVAVDAAGNLFIADNGSSRIRRVDAATGIITTFAGDGKSTFSGDDGAASNAELSGPQALAFDTAGSLYVTDPGNRRIRKIAVATPPLITSPATASGTQGAFFSYRITGSGHPAPSFSASALPDGLFYNNGLISGFPTVSGATDVLLTASNIFGSTNSVLRITLAKSNGAADNAPSFNSPPVTITITPNPGVVNQPINFVAPSTGDGDADLLAYDWDFGDGQKSTGVTTAHAYSAVGVYTVTVTASDGVSSISATAPVAVNAASVTQPVLISKASFKFNFTKQNADAVTLMGTIPLRTGFKTGGQTVTLYIGSLSRTFILNDKGGVTSKTDLIKLTASQKPGAFLDAAKQFYAGKFSITLKGQTLNSTLAALGFVKNVTNPVPLRVPVLITVSTDSYIQNLTVVYKSSFTSGSGSKLNDGSSIPGR
jgi:sugar lactone lactonase YvrE/PKD repeat protein